MKQMMIVATSLFLFATLNVNSVFGQQGPIHVPSPGIVDGVFLPANIPTKRVVPYEPVREADVVWSKRVWSFIDLRQKINHPLFYPLDDINYGGVWTKNATRWSLWTIIRMHIMNGDLTMFSPYNPTLMGFGGWDGDQLKYPIKPQDGGNFFTDSLFREQVSYYLGEVGPQSTNPCLIEDVNDPRFGEIKTRVDENGMEVYCYPPPDTTWFTSEDIIQYRLKEDWFFDKERSVMERRIIAIAPVRYTKEIVNGKEQITGMEEMFWLYFPHCRYVLNNYFAYNSHNDAQWMSFDDLFWKRKFHATIYKESNTYDREISTYRFGLDAIYEAETIKEEVRTIEHDVWSF
ncbi:MAG: gliding motility protein GldN [Fluviicola sp.]